MMCSYNLKHPNKQWKIKISQAYWSMSVEIYSGEQ